MSQLGADLLLISFLLFSYTLLFFAVLVMLRLTSSPPSVSGTVFRPTSIKESDQISIRNPKTFDVEKVSLARVPRPPPNVRGSSLNLTLLPAGLFEKETSYWGLSAIASEGRAMLEDRFIEWDRTAKPSRRRRD